MSHKNTGSSEEKLFELEQPSPGSLTVVYQPSDGEPIPENPPRFVWVPELDSSAHYAIKLVSSDGREEIFKDVKNNFYTPDITVSPGEYSWSYALWNSSVAKLSSDWSVERKFRVNKGLPESPSLRHVNRYDSCEMSHPRLWLNRHEVDAFRASISKDSSYCGWNAFFEKSVKPWIMHSLIEEPLPYPGNKRTPELWRKAYIDCQEALYATRNLAIAGVILSDEGMMSRSKEWLLHLSEWNPAGTTSREYNDESAFRIVGAIAWGYDWLYDELDDAEKEKVETVLFARLHEVAEHIIDHAKIHLFPYDSHAVRAISSVIVPCSIALLGKYPEAEVWLDYAIDYFETLYSPWCGVDGGWAEGPHYWTTAIAYYTEAANLVRKFMNHDLYHRAFFANTGYFPLYTKAPDTRRACFGDDSTLGDPPSLKVGYNMRQCAGITGNPYFQWYFERTCELSAGTEMEFYNYGWWDFAFDDLQYYHDFPVVTAKSPSDIDDVRYFPYIGWAAIQKYMDDPSRHIQFVVKSSPFGSISHSHADQGAFLLYAYGEDIAIQSGYYIGYGTSMHMKWRKLTKSKNAVLIDGKGQYAGSNKILAKKACGSMAEIIRKNDAIVISTDIRDAYLPEVPYLKKFRRDFHFVHDSFFVIIDDIELEEEAPVQWLFHTLDTCDISGKVFRYEGKNAGLTGEFVYCSSGDIALSCEPSFLADVDPSDYGDLPMHYCVEAVTPKSKTHRIITLLTPYPREQRKRIFNFIDDQGFSTNVYFQDDTDQMYCVSMQKKF
jgi:hypothetical protein